MIRPMYESSVSPSGTWYFGRNVSSSLSLTLQRAAIAGLTHGEDFIAYQVERAQGKLVRAVVGEGEQDIEPSKDAFALLERIVAVPETQRASKAREEVSACRRKRRPVPGFGHPIHRAKDPRVGRLLDIAREAGAGGSFIGAMELVAETVREELAKPLVTNVSAAIASTGRKMVS